MNNPDPISKMMRWAVGLLAMFVLIGAGTLGRIAWVMFYPYEPLIVHEPQKVLNPNKQVEAGGTVCLESHFTKNTNASATVTKMFVNTFIYYLAPYEASLPPAKNKRLRLPPIPVPPDAVPGKYRIYTTYRYKVSNYPERYITVPVWSEEFEVVKAKE